MFDLWNDFVSIAALALEAQGVVALRLAKIAAGGPAADAECRLMVEEKFAAVVAAQTAAARALAEGPQLPRCGGTGAGAGAAARSRQSPAPDAGLEPRGTRF